MPKELKLNEMSNVSISSIVDTLSKSYIKLIKDKNDLNLFPSVMLWGQPGVGKSESVREIAAEIEKSTKKKVYITDVRLLLFNPIDLRGIPVSDIEDGEKVARWLRPQIFKMDPSDDVINILFLDEISAAPQSVQAAAYQIALDKKVGEHALPKNCIVIAAGNRITDKSVAYKMPKALANRLLHFDVSVNFKSWKEWAMKNGVNPLVLGFLSYRQDLLNTFDSTDDELSFATPRSWVMVSNILNNITPSIDSAYQLISGLVGRGTANEFRVWNKIYSELPNIEDIFNGKFPTMPSEPSRIFVLSCAMIQYAKTHINELNRIANSIYYALKFPKDFSSILLKEYKELDQDLFKKLATIPEFRRMISENASLLNGKV